jgi:hypothetical protein
MILIKKEFLSFNVLLLQKLFDKIQQKEDGNETFNASKG